METVTRTETPFPKLQPHRLRAVASSPSFSGPHWACSCGRASYYCRTITSARSSHARHVAEVKARAVLAYELADDNAREAFLDMEAIFDWAERDASECVQLADDDESQREAKANLRLVARMRKVAMALLTIEGYEAAKTSGPA